MRYSIIFLLLCISFGLNAFEPPKEPEKKSMSKEELFKEARENKESYLSVLPAELIKMVGEYAHQSLEREIYNLREKNKKSQHIYQPDEIDKLAQQFAQYYPELNPSWLKIKIALLINHYSSFTIARYEMDKITGKPTMEQIFAWLAKYLQDNDLSYQEAIEYIRMFTYRLFFSYPEERIFVAHVLTPLYDHWMLNVFDYLSKNYQLFDNTVVPFVRIIVDMGDKSIGYPPGYFGDPILQFFIHDIKSGIRPEIRNVLSFWYSKEALEKLGTEKEVMNALSIAVCNSLVHLLREAFDSSDHGKAEFIVARIFNTPNLDKNVEQCFIEKFKGPLGQRIADYLLDKPAIFYSRITSRLFIILEHAFKSSHATESKLIKLLGSIDFNEPYGQIELFENKVKLFKIAVESDYFNRSMLDFFERKMSLRWTPAKIWEQALKKASRRN